MSAAGRRDRGSISVELAILMPGFIALIALAVVVGRQAIAQNAIELATYDAARAASLSRQANLARERAEAAARTTLAEQGLACSTLDVAVDVSQFNRPVGQPASVHTTITCTVSFADLLAVPGVPTARVLTAEFTSPLDQYRTRS